MPESFLMLIMILLYTFNAMFSRLYTDKYPCDKRYAPMVFAVVSGCVVGVVSFITGLISGGDFVFNPVTFIIGALNAFILYGYDEFLIKSSASGSYSVLMVFNLGGAIIIPSVIKAIVPYSAGGTVAITFVQIIAMAIICASVYMVSKKSTELEEKNAGADSGKFFVYCLCLALCNGLHGSLVDIQGELTGTAQKQLLLIYTHIGSAIIALVRLIIEKKKDFTAPFKQNKPSLIYLLSASLCAALAANMLVLLVGQVDLSLLYTFSNAGIMLFSSFAAMILFKEQLSALNIVGCVLMIFGLVVMGAGG